MDRKRIRLVVGETGASLHALEVVRPSLHHLPLVGNIAERVPERRRALAPHVLTLLHGIASRKKSTTSVCPFVPCLCQAQFGVRPGGDGAFLAIGLPVTKAPKLDLMPLMLRAQEMGTPADWLVRAQHNRCLPDGEKLWQHTGAGEPAGATAFAMAARHGVKARTVRKQLWVRKVELPAGKGKTVRATCIIAREIDAPVGAKPIEWRLLTNSEAGTLADSTELIDWYRARRRIEILLYALKKNACKVEALQLGSIEQLERALALFMVVAWRIAHLMRRGRICPDLDANLFLDPDEIQAAYLLRDKVPPAKPRLNEVLR